MKKVLSIILVLLLLTGFTACGQSDKASGNTTPSQSTSSGTSPSDAGENQTNLVIWTRDRADAVFMQPAIKDKKYHVLAKFICFHHTHILPYTVLFILPVCEVKMRRNRQCQHVKQIAHRLNR